MKKFAILIPVALLCLSPAIGSLAEALPEVDGAPMPQAVESPEMGESAAEAAVEEVALPDSTMKPTFLFDSGGPFCSGPNANGFCFQWALANCGGGGGHCRCSQWAFINGQFQCVSGCCDCN